MAIGNSNEFKIWVDLIEVPSVRNASLSFNASTINVTKGRTGSYSEKIIDRKSGTLSFDCVLDTDDLDRFNLNNEVLVRYGTEERSFVVNGYINSIDQTGGTDDVPSYSVSIDTTGEITQFIPIIEEFSLLLESGDIALLESGDNVLINIQTN